MATVAVALIGVGVFAGLGFRVTDIPRGFALPLLWCVGIFIALRGRRSATAERITSGRDGGAKLPARLVGARVEPRGDRAFLGSKFDQLDCANDPTGTRRRSASMGWSAASSRASTVAPCCALRNDVLRPGRLCHGGGVPHLPKCGARTVVSGDQEKRHAQASRHRGEPARSLFRVAPAERAVRGEVAGTASRRSGGGAAAPTPRPSSTPPRCGTRSRSRTTSSPN